MMPAMQIRGLRVLSAPARLGLGLAAAMLLTLSLSSCAWLDTKQRELALRPTPVRPTDAAKLRPGDLHFTVPVAAAAADTQHLALWWLPNPDPKAPTLLYLHGTFRNLYQNVPKIDALRDAGFAIVAVDYRGWGDSTSIVPSEETIVADAWLAWAELVRRQPDAGKRVVFGHSMGGAVAVALASQLRFGADYGALVLESTFTKMPDVAAAAGFWGSIGAAVTTLEFDALAKIGAVDAPVLMLHGTADKTVPVELGRRLRDAARPGVRWIEVPGGSHSRLHSEAPGLYRQALRDLMNGSGQPVSTLAPAAAR
jgi:pimeloyl-ACP methyl ester carboxylesterase